MVAQNQVVSSDPLNSWQIRHRGKIYHALTGSDMAYYGDHVELSDGGEDFASTIGIGGVPGTKFTIVETREFVEGSKLLTNEKKEIWDTYLNAYNNERISQGKYINLYDICYDKPEIHLIQKKEDLYYGIFSKGKFKEEISLKGLSPRKKYQVVDYINEKVLSSNISLDNNQILVEFEDHLLIKVSIMD
jgi:alpha-galactosidase